MRVVVYTTVVLYIRATVIYITVDLSRGCVDVQYWVPLLLLFLPVSTGSNGCLTLSRNRTQLIAAFYLRNYTCTHGPGPFTEGGLSILAIRQIIVIIGIQQRKIKYKVRVALGYYCLVKKLSHIPFYRIPRNVYHIDREEHSHICSFAFLDRVPDINY